MIGRAEASILAGRIGELASNEMSNAGWQLNAIATNTMPMKKVVEILVHLETSLFWVVISSILHSVDKLPDFIHILINDTDLIGTSVNSILPHQWENR